MPLVKIIFVGTWMTLYGPEYGPPKSPTDVNDGADEYDENPASGRAAAHARTALSTTNTFIVLIPRVSSNALGKKPITEHTACDRNWATNVPNVAGTMHNMKLLPWLAVH